MTSPEETRAVLLSLLTLGVGSLFLALICYVLFRRPRSYFLKEKLLQHTLRRLEESEGRFRILFEHGGAGLALLSADGSIVEANLALEKMLGYGPGQLVGLRLSDLSHPEDQSDYTLRIKLQPVSADRDQTKREKRYLRRDGGSTFHLFLPAVEETKAAAPTPAPTVQGSGECVLVVDDENMVRELARTVLERHGLRVLVAADGDEALAQYSAHRDMIDLVLLDYSLPGKTGLQGFEELRKIAPEVCVVFASGYALEGDASPLLAAGAQAFVAKPYRPHQLMEAVRKALASVSRDPKGSAG